MQFRLSLASPEQSASVPALVQVRVLVCDPVPQVSEQVVHVPQLLQVPKFAEIRALIKARCNFVSSDVRLRHDGRT